MKKAPWKVRLAASARLASWVLFISRSECAGSLWPPALSGKVDTAAAAGPCGYPNSLKLLDFSRSSCARSPQPPRRPFTQSHLGQALPTSACLLIMSLTPMQSTMRGQWDTTPDSSWRRRGRGLQWFENLCTVESQWPMGVYLCGRGRLSLLAVF